MVTSFSSLGNEIISQVAAQKKSVKGKPTVIKAPDLKTLNLDNDNKITTDELKSALAKQRGVAVEELMFVGNELADLNEDAQELTTLLRRGGQINKTDSGFVYSNAIKQPTLADLRTHDQAELPLTLQIGTSGEDIRKLRVLLNNLHAFEPDYTPLDERIDLYDEAVVNAIAEFQRETELGVTASVNSGVLDGMTLRRLEQMVENIVKETDIYTPYVPIEELPPLPDNDPKRLETMHDIMDQLGAKGLTADEIGQAFETGVTLADFLEQSISTVQAKYKGGSESFCYTGVKEALEGALNYKYQAFGGKGGSWASTADDYLFRKRPDIFVELSLSCEQLNYLPKGAIVVYEPGGVGHIGVKSYSENGHQLDLSDRLRTGKPYPNAKYKVFLPRKPVPEGDKAYATPQEASDLSHLMYAARQTQARKARRRT